MFAKYYQNKSSDSENENQFKSKYIITSNVMPTVSMEKALYDVSYKPCKCTCGWREELPESHIDHSKLFGCDYIKSKYDLSYDSDGEIIAKPKNIQKKPTKKKHVQQKQLNERYNDYKDDIIERYGKWTDENEDSFCAWYSYNFEGDV